MTLEIKPSQRDALPEHHRYRDTGCELHSACLTCPLPVCKEELSHGRQSVRARMRTLQINLLSDEGRSVEWIMQVMGVSRRTVYRAKSAQKSVRESLSDTLRRDTMNVAATPITENGRGHNGR
ncbi:hypothetical protein LCGC14_1761140 [marine sediment metagenome]|uniref:Resolvase HTH domain-containing protein n=1 Tax=marine sediment metagenome TaxID=412755 RepID=A0A0F9H126_9ZZZZ